VIAVANAALHFRNQRAPFGPRTPVVIRIRPGVLAPVVEELHALAFERLDFALDERVELRKLVGDLPGQVEVHRRVFLCVASYFRQTVKPVYNKLVYKMRQRKRQLQMAARSACKDGCCRRRRCCDFLGAAGTLERSHMAELSLDAAGASILEHLARQLCFGKPGQHRVHAHAVPAKALAAVCARLFTAALLAL
jgi:hypothetical protein